MAAVAAQQQPSLSPAGGGASTVNAENIVIFCKAMLVNRKYMKKCVELQCLTCKTTKKPNSWLCLLARYAPDKEPASKSAPEPSPDPSLPKLPVWDPDWVIPSTHRELQQYVWISASNFPDDVWLEKADKVRKLKDGSLKEFEGNLYDLPLELLSGHSMWGDRLCQSMRGKGKDCQKKLNAVMPSEEWIRERYLQHKDKIWEMKGVRISEMAAAEAAKEAEKEEEAKKSSEGEEEAEERDKVAASEAAAQDRSKGRGKRAPAGSESEANSESESESESDAEDDTEICSRWTLKMMEEEDADTCDGNTATETVVDLASLSHLPETEDDRESIKSPSKRGSLPHPLIHMLACLFLLPTC